MLTPEQVTELAQITSRLAALLAQALAPAPAATPAPQKLAENGRRTVNFQAKRNATAAAEIQPAKEWRGFTPNQDAHCTVQAGTTFTEADLFAPFRAQHGEECRLVTMYGKSGPILRVRSCDDKPEFIGVINEAMIHPEDAGRVSEVLRYYGHALEGKPGPTMPEQSTS